VAESSRSAPAMLIVDDEPEVLHVFSRAFAAAEYTLFTAQDGASAIEQLTAHEFQLVLLDLNMQPISGLQVLTELRRRNQETVVIILTAYSTLDSAIQALRLGAFDYLIKPVDLPVLRKRVEDGLAQYQRNHLLTAQNKGPESHWLRHGPLSLDLEHRVASLNDKPLDLTTSEFRLLHALVQAAPQPLSPTQLVSETLGYQCAPLEAASIIKFHIHELRQKVEPDPQKPQFIKTVRFEGYMWGG
jgi:Response regulators consisting of a CheY-like receiver domain and a winged-helix DNA-binding domain